ncbi:MAG: MATE family efflux transporter, partial [Terriglobales bacterium]
MAQSQTSSTPEAARDEGRLVQGSLWTAIWTMSWPLLLTTISASLIGLTDIKMAGILGSSQQAAVGLCEQMLFLFLVFIMSIGAGTTAMVSRAAGAGNHAEASECTAQSLSLSFGMGLVLSVLAFCFAKYGFVLMKPEPDVVRYGSAYLGVYSFYLIPFSIACQVNSSFRAIGDAKKPLIIVSCMTVINIVGDIATVMYDWPIHGLGLLGIPLSAITASSFGATLGLFFISRSELKDSLKRLLPVYWNYVERILRIGVPAALQRLSWAFSVFVLFFILMQ